MSDPGSELKVTFRSELDKGSGESVFVEFAGALKDVQRDVVEYFRLAPGAIDDTPVNTVLAAGQAWRDLYATLTEATVGVAAANEVLNTFPEAQVVNEATRRRADEQPPVRHVDEFGNHIHAAYAKALTTVTSSDEMVKAATAYAKLPDHDPELLQQMRARYSELKEREAKQNKTE